MGVNLQYMVTFIYKCIYLSHVSGGPHVSLGCSLGWHVGLKVIYFDWLYVIIFIFISLQQFNFCTIIFVWGFELEAKIMLKIFLKKKYEYIKLSKLQSLNLYLFILPIIVFLNGSIETNGFMILFFCKGSVCMYCMFITFIVSSSLSLCLSISLCLALFLSLTLFYTNLHKAYVFLYLAHCQAMLSTFVISSFSQFAWTTTTI